MNVAFVQLHLAQDNTLLNVKGGVARKNESGNGVSRVAFEHFHVGVCVSHSCVAVSDLEFKVYDSTVELSRFNMTQTPKHSLDLFRMLSL